MHYTTHGHKMSARVSWIAASRFPPLLKPVSCCTLSQKLVPAGIQAQSIFGQRADPFHKRSYQSFGRNRRPSQIPLRLRGVQMSSSAKSVLVPIATGCEEMEAVRS